MSITTTYIVISLIAAVFFIVHIWNELTDEYMVRREELDLAYHRDDISLREYEHEIKKLEEEMRKSA